MVSSRSFLCPFLISEVVSQKDEQDRCRMLVQAIAAARAGRYLIREGAEIQFFVVAIYLRANLTVERYVVANIGQGMQVCRSCRGFIFFPHGKIRFTLPRKISTLPRQMVQSHSLAKCIISRR